MGFDVDPAPGGSDDPTIGPTSAPFSDRLDALAIGRIFLVGGDASESGEFPDGLSRSVAMEEVGHSLNEIGSPPTRRVTPSSRPTR